MDTTCLIRTLDLCVSHLSSLDDDWSVQIPGLDWTVAQAVAHLAEGLLWYATDFVAGPTELSTLDPNVKPDATPADLVRSVSVYGTVLVRMLESSPPDTVGWHPYGLADASGFAAMGCDELLVHTYDASVRVPFTPPADIAALTVARLFPDAPTGHEPWETLLWCNGRIALGDLPRRERWRWSLS
ncbi:hypothetical protein Lesp02_69650 [Lentzea sp. NBRC 105346]|uniref:maleylpyruvate isomerase N-terminal domain-containing protein n=1 Tax=Lentzea sp. NBRC 105346 TaxID=3032205 RepID=UPI0024A08146|nr:maleylpyruvate isomerase N-terminal domain-containing protein [Lentzea sp. NBRC 105346]GLZ34778.1 hypothetical protein Lesp02_69650 [Lentzea sp. NBRC 105346]